ncbi:hypothetical protein HA402_006876 [Bradysia odoriphaga]|nr:hypothetical protein HA402_006876 [Bradysia odoriphaga]
MTIPSRPAPPPPQSVRTQDRQHSSSINQPQSRYGSTNWASFDNNLFEQPTDIVQSKKNAPPPRPPPPKVSSQPFKKPSQPTSVNLLSNLFGKAKLNGTKATTHSSNSSRPVTPNDIPKLAAPPTSAHSHDASLELISFDSPPNSPTLTQKSNSDCNSINSSFSSDSNNYLPQNGRTSQPESGFEDDFSFGKDPWEANDPFSPLPYEGPKSTTTPHQKPVTIGSTSFYSYDLYGSGTAKTSTDFVDPLCNGKSLLSREPALTKPTIIKPAITRPKPKLNNSYQNKGPAPSLPIPNAAAPSSNQPQEEFDENEPSYGIALYDFEPIQDGDLILRENEKVYLHKKLNDEWYYGKNRRGCEGMFPASYINVKVPIRESSSTKNQLSPATTSSPIQKSEPTARALYSFTAETHEDLSLQENDIITDLQRINDEWLYGRIGSRQGQFPANFVEFITT